MNWNRDSQFLKYYEKSFWIETVIATEIHQKIPCGMKWASQDQKGGIQSSNHNISYHIKQFFFRQTIDLMLVKSNKSYHKYKETNDIKVKQGMLRTSQDQKGWIQFKQMQLKGFHLCQPGSNKTPYPTNPSKHQTVIYDDKRNCYISSTPCTLTLLVTAVSDGLGRVAKYK